MFIRRFAIRNFKIHKDTSLSLFPITVFVGPNSGGKSAIFDALINFSMVCRGNLAEAFNQYPYSFDALRHHGASTSARIRYEAELTLEADSKESLVYMIEFSQNPGTNDEPTYSIQNEDLKFGNQVLFNRSDDICNIPGLHTLQTEGRSIFGALRHSAGEWNATFANGAPLVQHCAKEISRIGRYRLDPSLLAQPGRIFEIEPGAIQPHIYAPRVAYRGADLASVLYYLSETKSPVLANIIEIVAEAITGFEGFEFNHVGSDRIGFAARFVDKRGAVVAPNLSDGCLSMIGLVTLALTAIKPSVLCIEEPENGLTPRATRVFYRTIHKLTQAEPASERPQVLLSSHSPFVIVDAWNGNERDFIYQCHPSEGMAKILKFSEVIEGGLGCSVLMELSGWRSQSRLWTAFATSRRPPVATLKY
jgi:predicted ATPase